MKSLLSNSVLTILSLFFREGKRNAPLYEVDMLSLLLLLSEIKKGGVVRIQTGGWLDCVNTDETKCFMVAYTAVLASDQLP